MAGKLEKMKVQAVDANGTVLQDKAGNDLIYFALVNPETYKLKHKVVYNPSCPTPGQQGKVQQYSHTQSDNLQFDFLFDSTGVIPKPLTGLAGALSNVPIAGAIAGALDPQKYDIFEEMEHFKVIVLKYDDDNHAPRTVSLTWGTFSFLGKLTSLEFNYKLFQPDGTPIRVVATAMFIEETIKTTKPSSPDLTHIRVVKTGDTLPLMAYKIYGNPA